MPRKLNPTTQCHHRSQLNRRCHMLIAQDHPTLCAFHAKAEARSEARAETVSNAQAVAAELLAGTENLTQPASVNLFLANLLKNFANHRVSRKDATTLAYISQLLLNSQCVMHRQSQDAQAAKAEAKANQPQRLFLDAPRPNRRPHADDPCSGGSSDPCFSPNTHNQSHADEFNSLSESRENPANPVSTTTPTPTSVPAPSPQSAPPPRANTVLYTPDDHDPSTNAHPLPTRWGRQVHGFVPPFRRRNWPSGAPDRRGSLQQNRARIVRPHAHATPKSPSSFTSSTSLTSSISFTSSASRNTTQGRASAHHAIHTHHAYRAVDRATGMRFLSRKEFKVLAR